jgi:hypothetical protein
MKAPALVAKGTIALVVGLALGYAIGVSLAHDSEEGRALTMKTYIADFESHKAKLEHSQMPMWGSLLAGVCFTFATFLTYELLVIGVTKAIVAIDRRTSGGPDGLVGLG